MTNSQIGLVVDATYLYAAKDVIGSNVNYNRLVEVVRGMGNVRHAVCHIKANHGQRKFIGALKSQGFEVISKSANPEGNPWVADVADSIMNVSRYVNHLVVAVGDDRYTPILEWAWATWGCKVTLVGLSKDHLDDGLSELLDDPEFGASFLEIDSSFAYSAVAAGVSDSQHDNAD